MRIILEKYGYYNKKRGASDWDGKTVDSTGCPYYINRVEVYKLEDREYFRNLGWWLVKSGDKGYSTLLKEIEYTIYLPFIFALYLLVSLLISLKKILDKAFSIKYN